MLFSKTKKGEKAGVVMEPTPEATKPSTPTAGDATADEPASDPLTQTETTRSELQNYPAGLKLFLIILSIFISMFLVALDRLIIATAIPQITDDFRSVTDIGWYGSAYLLSTCACQLLFGKFYTFFNVKVVFLIAIFLFEVGSTVCGAAPSSVVFIIGRAIAGLGAAGITSGVIVILVDAVPLHERPKYQGLFGAIFGVASVTGPLLGGALTTNATWRWCFYINLPLGGVALIVIAFILKVPERDTKNLSLKAKLAQLDFAGTAVLAPGTICLLLSLQWGGLEHPWNDARIVAMLVLAAVLLIAFVLIQVFLPKTATIPPRIFVQRSILAGCWSALCIGSQMMVFVYFLPIWFQAIKGESAIGSGIKTLPLVLSMVAAAILSGVTISKIGYYTPVMLVGCCFMSVGAGLLTTLNANTPQANWIGYQFLYGFGLGMSFQAPNIAAQTVLHRIDVPIGTSLMFFFQLLGGAVFISVGQNVLNNQLLQRLSGLPGFTPEFFKNAGATTLTHLPDDVRGVVLDAYNESLRKVFQVGLILVCLTFFGAAAMEWKSVKKNKPTKKADAEKGESQEEKKIEEDGTDVDEKRVGEEKGTDGSTLGPDADEKRVEEDKVTVSTLGTKEDEGRKSPGGTR